VVAYIEACRDQFGVEPACRALRQAGVAMSPSGYYAARARPPSARAVRDAALEKQILRVYKDSGERYGAWKVWDQLNREGVAAARCTVERLMRKPGLRGVRRGGYKKPRTTVPDPAQQRPADLVSRDFAPDAPDRLWVVDFTFVATWAGTACTAFVIDAFARLIAGWRTAAHHSTALVLDALVMAVTYRARQGVNVAGLIHHSDAGSEYLSIRYGAELAAAGIAPSVGTAGDSYDNALAESIIGLYKAEVIDHLGPWETPARVEAATAEWASWYNTRRVMRRTGGRPPAEYEQAWRDGTLGQVPARGPAAGPGGQQKEAAMAAADYPGGLRPHPPGRCPGPQPSSEMPPQARTGAAAGGYLLAGRMTGATEPPPRSRAPPASHAMTLRVTHDQPGEPAARSRECPTRRYPGPGDAWAGHRPPTGGSGTAQLDRCSIKTKRKNDQACGSVSRRYRGRQRSPRREHLGRIESPPNSGCSTSWAGWPGPARCRRRARDGAAPRS
jgi:putative transposase